ncbi:MAG: hypothetical protein VX874_15755 [Pseudomonadota bacterium]|nr:hypothetical protein [Pseudomonadota bacterium]
MTVRILMKRTFWVGAVAATITTQVFGADFDEIRVANVLSETQCEDLMAIMGDASAPDGDRPFDRVALWGLLIGFTYAETGVEGFPEALSTRVEKIRADCERRPGAFLYEILAE